MDEIYIFQKSKIPIRSSQKSVQKQDVKMGPVADVTTAYAIWGCHGLEVESKRRK